MKLKLLKLLIRKSVNKIHPLDPTKIEEFQRTKIKTLSTLQLECGGLNSYAVSLVAAVLDI